MHIPVANHSKIMLKVHQNTRITEIPFDPFDFFCLHVNPLSYRSNNRCVESSMGVLFFLTWCGWISRISAF